MTTQNATPATPTSRIVFGCKLSVAKFEAWEAHAAQHRRQHDRDPYDYEFEQWLRRCKERFDKAGFPDRPIIWLRQWHRGEVEAQNETWLAHWERVKASIGGPGVTLALTGGRGTGKTQLATAAGWHVCYSDRSAIYSRAAMLFTRIKSSYGHDARETEAKVLKEIIGTQLLVLDEIGETRETDFEGKMMANIVCQRHDYGRDTILISNQSYESLARSVGESITDRIAEGGGIYTFNWPSFRRVGV